MSNKYLIIPNQFYVQGSPRYEPFRDPYIFKVSGKLVLFSFLYPLSIPHCSFTISYSNAQLQFKHMYIKLRLPI